MHIVLLHQVEVLFWKGFQRWRHQDFFVPERSVADVVYLEVDKYYASKLASCNFTAFPGRVELNFISSVRRSVAIDIRSDLSYILKDMRRSRNYCFRGLIISISVSDLSGGGPRLRKKFCDRVWAVFWLYLKSN